MTNENPELHFATEKCSSSSEAEKKDSACFTDDVMYTNCRMEELPCYHESITRNVAEILLLNAEVTEGSYLIRPSHLEGNYSVSVRIANSVKHFQITHNGQWYSFGHTQFWTPLDIWTHLQKSPVLECEEGTRVHLLQPYYNEKRIHIPLPEVEYSTIKRHYIPDKQAPVRRISNNIVTSLEGALHKKKEGKTWKRRWCILKKNYLSYKKTEKMKKVIKTLDLSEASDIRDDNTEPKPNCFRIIFPNTSYIFSSDTPEDKDVWLKNIKWQIDEATIVEKSTLKKK